jgi:hypothetical protein
MNEKPCAVIGDRRHNDCFSDGQTPNEITTTSRWIKG